MSNLHNIPRSSGLRLIGATLLVLPVGVVMLSAGTVVTALVFTIQPFARIRDYASALLRALLREIGRPS